MDNSNKGWDEYIITWARDKSVDGLLRCHRCALPPGRIKVLVRTSSDVSFEPRQRCQGRADRRPVTSLMNNSMLDKTFYQLETSDGNLAHSLAETHIVN